MFTLTVTQLNMNIEDKIRKLQQNKEHIFESSKYTYLKTTDAFEMRAFIGFIYLRGLYKKKLYGPFSWMGFNCLKATATSRRQFTFYHSVLRNFWYSFGEGLGQIADLREGAWQKRVQCTSCRLLALTRLGFPTLHKYIRIKDEIKLAHLCIFNFMYVYIYIYIYIYVYILTVFVK